MKRQVWKFFGLLVLPLMLALGTPFQGRCESPVPSKAKPALYEFGAKTCIPCIQMQKVMAELKVSHGDKVEFRMIYVDEERDLFRQYRIMLIPTQVFLNSEGQEVERHIGPLTKEEVLRKLNDLRLIN